MYTYKHIYAYIYIYIHVYTYIPEQSCTTMSGYSGTTPMIASNDNDNDNDNANNNNNDNKVPHLVHLQELFTHSYRIESYLLQILHSPA